ncbi:hypothetical protein KDH_23420 [Dictyobacter sp. S3.2.2.5]|uniref:Uncharacterized protein n=1 Tax=Dictyobacter halimunensis TaxID=3026934 RepID=A0ABQ6FMM7_9CHLR|nr:hypothetical protein KDH_23420 [Dictyobacter sp. S3.2.2.5]
MYGVPNRPGTGPQSLSLAARATVEGRPYDYVPFWAGGSITFCCGRLVMAMIYSRQARQG